MDNETAREVAKFHYWRAKESHLVINCLATTIGYIAQILPSPHQKGAIIVLFDNPSKDMIFVYNSSRNALELVRSKTPPWIVLDALLESPDEEWTEFWSNKAQVPLARELLEKIALMDLVPSEQS